MDNIPIEPVGYYKALMAQHEANKHIFERKETTMTDQITEQMEEANELLAAPEVTPAEGDIVYVQLPDNVDEAPAE